MENFAAVVKELLALLSSSLRRLFMAIRIALDLIS
jgi:hypothetical protein